MTYSKKGAAFIINLICQLPRLLKTIKYENNWLKEIVANRKLDAVISDNRYGLHHPSLPCVMMTHQVLAQTGIGKWADRLLSKVHYKHIKKYHQCWVIDVEGTPNLSGDLAHPKQMPENAKFIGLLSQLADENLNDTTTDHILILLSGPEPQRTMLSDILWEQAKTLDKKIVFVEGSNAIKERKEFPSHISYHKQLTKDDLLPLLKAASIVICRSGYSTLMDLVALDKKAILIPTPGQTEQEYLGKHLHKEGVYLHANQNSFSLQRSLNTAENFPFRKLPLKDGLFEYKKALNDWLASL